MEVLVIITGKENGSNKKPYITKRIQPSEFTNLNLITDFIKKEIKTVAIAAYPNQSTTVIPSTSIII